MTIRKCWVCASYANQLNCEPAEGEKGEMAHGTLFQLLHSNYWDHLLEVTAI